MVRTAHPFGLLLPRWLRWPQGLVLGLLLCAAPAKAQDQRVVVEPHVPPSCAVVIAQFQTAAQALGQVDDQVRIQRALDQCATGHALHLAPSNELQAFVAGPLSLPSGVTLVIDAGATLYASTDPARYDRGGKACGTMAAVASACRAFLTAQHTQGSAVMGAGVIDGQGGQPMWGQAESWWQLARRAQREARPHHAPRLLEVEQSSEFTLYQVTLRNSPHFHVSLHQVNGFTAWGVKIDAPVDARNTDGIDPISSRNITIAHSAIRTGDDNIAIKAGLLGPSEDISIHDVHFYSGHGLSIGSETSGGVRHVLAQHLSFDGTNAGLRIKSDISRGGLVEHVAYQDVCLRGVKTPIDFSTHYDPQARGELVPWLRDISLGQVISLSPGRVVLRGFSAQTPLQVRLDAVYIAPPSPVESEFVQLTGHIDSTPDSQFQAHAADCEQRFVAWAPRMTPQPRPQLTAQAAQRYDWRQVLSLAGRPGHAQQDPWDPYLDLATLNSMANPDYVVSQSLAADGKRVFNQVQAAVNRAAQDLRLHERSQRVLIQVQPGTYHELVYVPALPAPLSIVGTGSSPADTVITADLDAAVSGSEYQQRYGSEFEQVDPGIRAMYELVRARANLTTFGSATLWTRNFGFSLVNLSVRNSYRRLPPNRADICVEDCRNRPAPVMHQAVALMVDGADKSVFDRVWLAALQDTLYLKNQDDQRTARSFFWRSRIEGDVDYIFGDATAYFLDSDIVSLGSRPDSYVAAPSTDVQSHYGFVFDQCRFQSDGSPLAAVGRYRLARQWFHNQKCTPYGPVAMDGYTCRLGSTDVFDASVGQIRMQTVRSVGKMVVLHSQLGGHISATHPWADWNQSGKLSYRPVQVDEAAYRSYLLQAWPDLTPDQLQGLGADGSSLAFLAEYQNTAAPPTAGPKP